ncbi:murein transglycosylase [Bdellovibrio bacteriovorus]|uniref:Murein transglycosylase n=2 Tax=Bdellovibrio bacteriovorus TaxID=959 RepID=A0A150WTC3_BDEBC|nr:murein transglycosylase [Bdellovibrio bacteriovorus]
MSMIAVCAAAVGLVSCAASKSSDGLALNPTIYYKPTIHQSESKCASTETRDLVSVEGKRLITLCQKDYDNCLLQGSCFVDDGKEIVSFNYHSTKEGVPRFMVVDTTKCPYGYGVRGICLDPYFSVAADLSVYDVGEVLFIPRLVGAELPTGEVHDGYVIVRDAGGAIKGANRLDFFTGFFDHRQKANTLARLGFGDPKNRFEFRRASSDERALVQEQRGYPGLKPSNR